jgi:hypothetical protein
LGNPPQRREPPPREDEEDDDDEHDIVGSPPPTSSSAYSVASAGGGVRGDGANDLQCVQNGDMDLAFRRTDRPRMQSRLSCMASRPPPPPPSVLRPLRTRLATFVMPRQLFPVAGRGLARRGREE